MTRFLNKFRKNKKGFTLIELIVVIVILAILAAVIVPRILGFVQDARDSADASNARSLYNAVVLGLSTDEIAIPAAKATYTTYGGLSGIEVYLDEWPTNSGSDPLVPFAVIITTAGEVGVYLNSAIAGVATNVPLAGKDVN